MNSGAMLQGPARAAFTLIELLVVIAVIALLVGLILPAISISRQTAQAVICTSNLRQLSVAVNAYAVDWKDQVWPKFDWAPIRDPMNRMGKGLLYQYVDDVDKISECVTNKRRSINGQEGTNAFGGRTGLNFDYTMVSRVEGARLGMPTMMAYVTDPERYRHPSRPPMFPRPGTPLTALTGIPVYVEESIYFNNNGITDGLWGNGDQVTRRHLGDGNVAYLEGHAGVFEVPAGPREEVREDRDFDANDLYVSGGSRWVRMEPNDVDNGNNWRERPYGWINAPR